MADISDAEGAIIGLKQDPIGQSGLIYKTPEIIFDEEGNRVDENGKPIHTVKHYEPGKNEKGRLPSQSSILRPSFSNPDNTTQNENLPIKTDSEPVSIFTKKNKVK